MAKTAFLIGGTGQIGSATAALLQEHGWDVTVASRSGEEVPGARPVQLDREDTNALVELASGHDLVLDTVAYSVDHADQLAKLSGSVGSLVVISTVSVYLGDNGTCLDSATGADDFPVYPVPVTEEHSTVDSDEQSYSAMKAAMERRLLSAPGLPVSILRPGAIHGPHSPNLREWFFIKRALDGRKRVVLAYDGASRFDPVATANIAELVRLCAEQPGVRALNAVDDEHPSVREIGDTVFAAMGHEAEFVTFAGPPLEALGASPWGIPGSFVMSMDRARDELGYSPVVSYSAGVERDIEWMTREVAAAQSQGLSWQDRFPRMAERYGAAHWFPYEVEDEYVSPTKGPA